MSRDPLVSEHHQTEAHTRAECGLCDRKECSLQQQMNVLRDGIVHGAINHGNVGVLRRWVSPADRLAPSVRRRLDSWAIRTDSPGQATFWGIKSGYCVAMSVAGVSRTNHA